MLDPISLVGISLLNDIERMNVISNNAANTLTPGFKRELTAVTGRRVIGASPMDSSFVTVPTQTIVKDVRAGMLKRTGVPFDIALTGDGFLEIQTPQNTAYTRMGTFRLDDAGRLVTQDGFPVMGTAGEIFLKTQTPVIDRDGQIFENNIQVGELKMTHFEQPEKLENIGGGLLLAPRGLTLKDDVKTQVVQGHLEGAAVDSAHEMISLVETFRHFEAGIRVIQAYDDVRDKTFRHLGQF